MRLVLCTIAGLLFSAVVPVPAQDLTIVSRVSRDGGPPRTSVSYMSRDRVRMAHGDGNEAIVDFKSGSMTTLDAKKKTYYVTTRQELDALAATMKERRNSPEMKDARKAMKNLPAEDQKKMDAAMEGMFAVNVEKTGGTRRIAGYTCENWTMTMGQMSRSQECLTNEVQFPAQAWDMYRGFAESMKSVMTAFGPMARSAAKMQDQLKKMKGFPLASTTTVDVMGHKTVIASEVTEVKRGPIPASAWEIPAGYRKVDNPMLKAFQAHTRK